jgi:hypothetical protein
MGTGGTWQATILELDVSHTETMSTWGNSLADDWNSGSMDYAPERDDTSAENDYDDPYWYWDVESSSSLADALSYDNWGGVHGIWAYTFY